MAFGVKLMGFRDWCRGKILPVSELVDIIQCVGKPHNILDFGAGTLFWTKRFIENYPECIVYAVDTFYADHEAELPKLPNVFYRSDVKEALAETEFELVWCCDILHHISAEMEHEILTAISARTSKVIIKDIDCTHRFGNFMNRMHDQYLNGEHIRNIDPQCITALFESLGFSVEYHYLPKLWYPHFLLIASRKNETDYF